MWLPGLTGSAQSLQGKVPISGCKERKMMKFQYGKGMAQHLLLLLWRELRSCYLLQRIGGCQRVNPGATGEKLMRRCQGLGPRVWLLGRWKYFLRKSQLEGLGGRYTEKAGITWQLDDALVEEKWKKCYVLSRLGKGKYNRWVTTVCHACPLISGKPT